MKKPPDDSEKRPPDKEDINSLVDKLVAWIKESPEKIIAIIHSISKQMLDLLPAKLVKQIKALLMDATPDQKQQQHKEKKEKKQQQDKLRTDELTTVQNIDQKLNRDNTREPKTQLQTEQKQTDQQRVVNQAADQSLKQNQTVEQQQGKPVDKSQEQAQGEKQQKPADKRPDKQADKKQIEKTQEGRAPDKDKKAPKGPKGPKPPKSKGPKGQRPDNNTELATIALLEEEKRQMEEQHKTAAKSVGKDIVDFATQHGVNVAPAAISNDKAVSPMAAADSNSLAAANQNKPKDGRST